MSPRSSLKQKNIHTPPSTFKNSANLYILSFVFSVILGIVASSSETGGKYSTLDYSHSHSPHYLTTNFYCSSRVSPLSNSAKYLGFIDSFEQVPLVPGPDHCLLAFAGNHWLAWMDLHTCSLGYIVGRHFQNKTETKIARECKFLLTVKSKELLCYNPFSQFTSG